MRIGGRGEAELKYGRRYGDAAGGGETIGAGQSLGIAATVYDGGIWIGSESVHKAVELPVGPGDSTVAADRHARSGTLRGVVNVSAGIRGHITEIRRRGTERAPRRAVIHAARQQVGAQAINYSGMPGVEGHRPDGGRLDLPCSPGVG